MSRRKQGPVPGRRFFRGVFRWRVFARRFFLQKKTLPHLWQSGWKRSPLIASSWPIIPTRVPELEPTGTVWDRTPNWVVVTCAAPLLFFIVLSRSWLGWFDDTIVTTEIQLKSIFGKNMKVLSITALKSNLSTPLYHHTSCYYVILSFVKIKGSSLSLPIWFRKLSAESSHLPKCWIIPKEISWVPKNLTRKCWQETCHIAAMAGLRLWDRYSIYCQLIGGFHKCTTHGVWGTKHNAFTLK